MRASHAALLGGLLGTGLGAALMGVFGPGSTRTVDTGTVPAGRVSPDSGGPALEGRAGDAAARRAAATVSLDLSRHGRAKLPSDMVAHTHINQLWRAVVGALLFGDDPEPGFAALEAALAAGIAPEEIESLLSVLPPERVREVLRRLHPRLQGRELSPWLAARAAEAAGGLDQAFERGLVALETGPDVAGSVALLLRIDRARAEAAVKRLATEKRWDGNVLGAIAEGFRAVMGDEAAQQWHAEAGRRRTEDAEVRIAEHRRAVEAAPDDPDAWSLLAGELSSDGHRDEAIAAYVRLLQLDPLDHEALHALAELDVVVALPFLEAAVKTTPATELLQWIAHGRLRSGRFAAAVEAVLSLPLDDLRPWLDANVAAVAPQAVFPRIESMLKSLRGRRDGVLHRARADALAALGRESEAFESYAEALRMGNEHGYNDLEGEDVVRRMVALDATGTEAFLKAMPEDPQQLRGLGVPRVAAAQGRPESLIAILERLAEDGSTDARAELGALVGGPWREGVLRDAGERPDDPDAQAHLARMEELRGRPAEARAAYDRALRFDGSDVRLEVHRALLR